MDDYAGDVGQLLADRYRLLLSPAEAEDVLQWRAYDTAAGQEVLVRQVPLPEVVDAELIDDDPDGDGGAGGGAAAARRTGGRATRRPADPGVRRAVEAAFAASQLPDHPRLDQVFDVFVEGDGLWIVSELLPARPLASLLAERPLSPHRAAEIGADLLAALRAVHAQGWTHRNVTARTVLVGDDGHAMLTGLAAGAAEETLCGYDVLPLPAAEPAEAAEAATDGGTPPQAEGGPDGSHDVGRGGEPAEPAPGADVPSPVGGGSADAGGTAGVGRPVRGAPWDDGRASDDAVDTHAYATGGAGAPARGAAEHGPVRPRDAGGPAARGAIAAFHAGTRAASGRDAGRWPFGTAEGAEESRPGSAVVWGDEGTDDERRPFTPPHQSAAPGGETEWWPFDEAREDAAPTPPLPAGWEPAGQGGASGTPTHGSVSTRSASLGAERARDARLNVVGAVTERWAPELAGAPQPVGPAADLWALGALLFRAVQGRPPYPEEAAAELVQLVCAGPPAAVESCGPLQPVVESLLRQDPAERCDEQELRRRLLAIVRSAPEPEVGRHTLVGPPSLEPGGPADPRRLPIVRRRGELVRRRRAAKRPKQPKPSKQPKLSKRPNQPRQPASSGPPKPTSPRKAPPLAPPPTPAPAAAPTPGHRRRRTGSPRSLGRLLVGLVLLLLTGAVLYAMWFLPKQGGAGDDGLREERSSVGGPAPESSAGPSRTPSPANTPEPKVSRTQEVPAGFALYDAPSGFRIAVPHGWHHGGTNGRGQVRFDKGDFEMVVVKGRDSAKEFGSDPMAYQSDDEPELKPYRTSDWATATGLRRIDVGGHAMAEGTFTWKDSSGREVYVRNRALILDGRYHLVLVMGPSDARDKVDRYFEGAVDSYRVLSR